MFELQSAETVSAPNGLEKEQCGGGGGGGGAAGRVLLRPAHPPERQLPEFKLSKETASSIICFSP